MSEEPLLRVRDLRVRYPVGRSGLLGKPLRWLHAVDGLSLDVRRGEALGLVGESGCGKSSAARAIAGLQPAASGSVKLDGVELTGLSRRQWLPLRRRLQMVFQDPSGSLDPRQTISSVLTEPLRIHAIGKPYGRRLRALELLDAVGLSPSLLGRYPHELSGGQRQRIGIARALALEPELVICDEPVSSLDVAIRAQVINLLAELRDRFDLSYLFIAHDLSVVRHLCRRVAVMYLGRTIEVADRDELYRDPRHPYTRALLSAVPLPDPARERGRRRAALAGEVPSPLDPPSGCVFHPRCPDRDRVPEDRCGREEPAFESLEGSRSRGAACHLARGIEAVQPMP